MQLISTYTRAFPIVNEFSERMEILNLRHYASEAASQMKFGSIDELQDSVKRAMDLCLSAGVPIKGNFQRVYKGFDSGLTNDWKLSLLAYHLVCLNGNSSNPNVAHLIIQLIKDQHLNYFKK